MSGHAFNQISWTVVLTTFNRPVMVRRAIESCIAQTVPCEIVVVDDGTMDEISYVAEQFPQIVYIRNAENLGHSASANLGISRAQGAWIKHLDDDDFLHPDCLLTMTHAIMAAREQGHDPKIVTCVAANLDLQGTTLAHTRTLPISAPALMKRENLLAMMMCDQAPLGTPVQVAHERQAALDEGGWNVNRPKGIMYGDDAECWIRLASRGDALFLPDVLSYRTIWSGNQSSSHKTRRDISIYLKRRISERMGGKHQGRIPSDIARYLNLHWGLVALKDGELLTGLKFVLGGMFHPRSYRYIRRRSRFADAIKLVYVLE
ncbi:MAG: glycosyl transferase [Rhodospirillales bacterium]|nr:glycosyl transferase [Rhodospirillales bacterium]